MSGVYKYRTHICAERIAELPRLTNSIRVRIVISLWMISILYLLEIFIVHDPEDITAHQINLRCGGSREEKTCLEPKVQRIGATAGIKWTPETESFVPKDRPQSRCFPLPTSYGLEPSSRENNLLLYRALDINVLDCKNNGSCTNRSQEHTQEVSKRCSFPVGSSNTNYSII